MQIFLEQEINYQDPVIFNCDRYSMDFAVQILEKLEQELDCEILNNTWKSSGYGQLVEIGIPVRLGTLEFKITCSYEDILVSRISGSKRKFYSFCESIRTMNFKTD